MAKVSGIAMWASVNTPNTRFEPMYCIDLIVSEADAKKLKAEGVKVKRNDDGEPVVKFRRKLYRKGSSEENQKPKCVDAKLNPYTGLIGNGSKVVVQYNVYDWTNSFGSGKGVDLQGVQILELVEFVGRDGSEFEATDEGFTVVPPTKHVAKANDVDFDDDLPFGDD